MCDLTVMELTAGVTAFVLWATIMSFAAFVNVACWATIRRLVKESK